MLVKLVAALAALLPFSLIACGAGPGDGAALQGTWLPTAAELGGQQFPEEIRKTIMLVIKDDKYTVTVGPAVDRGTLKMNPSAAPKTLDITGTDGPNKGRTFPAIYDLSGDTLRICYDLSGKGRPTEFITRSDTQFFLVTYTRQHL